MFNPSTTLSCPSVDENPSKMKYVVSKFDGEYLFQNHLCAKDVKQSHLSIDPAISGILKLDQTTKSYRLERTKPAFRKQTRAIYLILIINIFSKSSINTLL